MKPLRLALLLVLAGTSLPNIVVADSPRRPNVVLVIADDLGWGDLGCYGGTAIPTPHLDRLAREGRRFTAAYAPSSTCTPSRYALLTGEYPWRQPPKKTAILDGDAPLSLDPARPTLASFLRDHGYTTALVGKWHLGLGDGNTPVDFNRRIAPGPRECGFDEAFFIPATVDRVPTVFIEGDRVANLDPADPLQVSYVQRIGSEPVGHEHPELLKYPADRQHADTIVNGISRIGHLAGGKSARWIDEDIADVLTHHATDFIARQTGKRPFFLLLGTHDPHVPRAPAPRFRGQSAAGIRGDAIVQLDWMVGEVLFALERSGHAGDTIVLFTSDNGPVLFDGYFDGAAEANSAHRAAGPWSGWKYLRYEGGVRVPLILRWPGRVQPGVSEALVSLLDFFPTLAAAIEQPYPATAGRDGENLLPALRGDQGARGRAELVLHGIGNVLALRAGDWKFIPANADTATGIGRGADPRDQRFGQARVENDLLFNLANDPGETTNLAESHPEKLTELRARLAAIADNRYAP